MVARAEEVNRPARTMSGMKQAIRITATRTDPRGGALPLAVSGHPRNVRILPKSGNSH